jgi:hypothetical protein
MKIDVMGQPNATPNNYRSPISLNDASAALDCDIRGDSNERPPEKEKKTYQYIMVLHMFPVHPCLLHSYARSPGNSETW